MTKSFLELLKFCGIDEKYMTAVSENLEDQIDFEVPPLCVIIADSLIHGKGVFVTQNLKTGDVIAPARINGKRTPVGRYVNHGEPNASMVMDENNNVDLVASVDIKASALYPVEILTDYLLNYTNTRLK